VRSERAANQRNKLNRTLSKVVVIMFLTRMVSIFDSLCTQILDIFHAAIFHFKSLLPTKSRNSCMTAIILELIETRPLYNLRNMFYNLAP
jgi:hypothetical protein